MLYRLSYRGPLWRQEYRPGHAAGQTRRACRKADLGGERPAGRCVASELLHPERKPQEEGPFADRRVLPYPQEPPATAVTHTLRDYLRAEDAFCERGSARR